VKNTIILHAIGSVGDDLIERAASVKKTVRGKTVPWFKWAVPAAACLAAVIAGTIILSRLPNLIDDPDINYPAISSIEPAVDDSPVYNPDMSGGDIGGGNDISYRYFPIAENTYVATQVVGQEAADDWYVNYYLSQPPLEAIALPALYQMINAFGINKDDLVLENEKHIGSSNYLDEYVIYALYQEEALMMYLLRHPLALYFDGEIYTYYQMRGNTDETVQSIPAEVKAEFFALVETRSEADEALRELKENIDAFWISIETGTFP